MPWSSATLKVRDFEAGNVQVGIFVAPRRNRHRPSGRRCTLHTAHHEQVQHSVHQQAA
jgi:hypothetical protein